MKRAIIAEQWDQYARKVLPANCHPVQRQETRWAFYAGGRALMASMMEHVSPGAEMTANDLTFMADLNSELEEFCLKVQAGTA